MLMERTHKLWELMKLKKLLEKVKIRRKLTKSWRTLTRFKNLFKMIKKLLKVELQKAKRKWILIVSAPFWLILRLSSTGSQRLRRRCQSRRQAATNKTKILSWILYTKMTKTISMSCKTRKWWLMYISNATICCRKRPWEKVAASWINCGSKIWNECTII